MPKISIAAAKDDDFFCFRRDPKDGERSSGNLPFWEPHTMQRRDDDIFIGGQKLNVACWTGREDWGQMSRKEQLELLAGDENGENFVNYDHFAVDGLADNFLDALVFLLIEGRVTQDVSITVRAGANELADVRLSVRVGSAPARELALPTFDMVGPDWDWLGAAEEAVAAK